MTIAGIDRFWPSWRLLERRRLSTCDRQLSVVYTGTYLDRYANELAAGSATDVTR